MEYKVITIGDNYEGYNIKKELEAYNAKSLKKTAQNKTIFQVVI